MYLFCLLQKFITLSHSLKSELRCRCSRHSSILLATPVIINDLTSDSRKTIGGIISFPAASRCRVPAVCRLHLAARTIFSERCTAMLAAFPRTNLGPSLGRPTVYFWTSYIRALLCCFFTTENNCMRLSRVKDGRRPLHTLRTSAEWRFLARHSTTEVVEPSQRHVLVMTIQSLVLHRIIHDIQVIIMMQIHFRCCVSTEPFF